VWAAERSVRMAFILTGGTGVLRGGQKAVSRRRVWRCAVEGESVERTREKLKELEELARVEEKYGRKDLVKSEDVAALRDAGLKQYNKLLFALVSDTVFLGALGASAVSFFYPIKFVASYGLGLVGSLIYIFLLSRSVDRLAVNARQGQRSGDLLGPARYLVLVAIVLFIQKNQAKTGLEVIPATVGFLTYKLALLLPLLAGEETIDL